MSRHLGIDCGWNGVGNVGGSASSRGSKCITKQTRTLSSSGSDLQSETLERKGALGDVDFLWGSGVHRRLTLGVRSVFSVATTWAWAWAGGRWGWDDGVLLSPTHQPARPTTSIAVMTGRWGLARKGPRSMQHDVSHLTRRAGAPGVFVFNVAEAVQCDSAGTPTTSGSII